MEHRILTTHTGSLPRPDDLAQMVIDRDEGKNVDGFDERLRGAVGDIVQQQRDAGVDILSDGEQSKISYSTYIKDRLTGFEGEPSGIPGGDIELRGHPDFTRQFLSQVEQTSFMRERPACTGQITYRDHTAVRRDISNLRAAAGPAGTDQVFMTAASPGVVSLFFGNTHYPSHEEYVEAIAEAMREEYEEIANAGILLQLDCPDLAFGPGFVNREEGRRMVARHVEALNQATRNIPPDRLRLHVCWGNYDGPHEHDVELKDIVDLLLTARPSGLSIEASNPRHAHEWEVFQEVPLPEGKYLIPGVVESTNNFVEHPRVVAQRLLNYARLVGAERVMAGSDCGFNTFLGRGAVAPSIAWAKLRSMADGARMASQELAKSATSA